MLRHLIIRPAECEIYAMTRAGKSINAGRDLYNMRGGL